jgi:alpha-1,3-mannosyltransferase
MATQRSLRSLLQAIALLAVFFLLIAGCGFFQYGDSLSRLKPIFTGSSNSHPSSSDLPHAEGASGDVPAAVPPATSPTTSSKKGNATQYEQAPPYIHAILNPSDTKFPHLECPKPNLDRHAYVGSPEASISAQLPRYFFALDLHQCVHLLPRLVGSIVETMRFLGPQNCVLSIVEGRSDDGTFGVLEELRTSLQQLLGIRYVFQTSDINPTAKGTDRIEGLAELRNLALKNFVAHPERYDKNTTVTFSNDIALCMEDILELLHQRKF